MNECFMVNYHSARGINIIARKVSYFKEKITFNKSEVGIIYCKMANYPQQGALECNTFYFIMLHTSFSPTSSF